MRPSFYSQMEDVLEALRQGQIVALVDDAAPELSAYLVANAASVSQEDIAFIINHARGLVCAVMSEARVRELRFPMMSEGKSDISPDFTVSVEARQGVTTGISAYDRARTLRTLAKTSNPKLDLVMPGHIFPIRSKNGGVLVKSGPAEAMVDLLELAGLVPVAASSKCLTENGEYLGGEDIEAFVSALGLASTSICRLIEHRLSSESVIEQIAEADLPSSLGSGFRAIAFRSTTDGAEHLAIVKGQIKEEKTVLARVQAEQRIGDLLDVDKLPSRGSIHRALRAIEKEGKGIFVYVRHPGRGKLKQQVLELNSKGTKTPLPSLLREYGLGVQILRHLGPSKIRLLSNSKKDIVGIDAFKLEIVEHVSF